MKPTSFGEKLRLVRNHYGITITEMSEKINVVKSNISRYERDLNKPTVPFVELLLKHYRVNLNWLFGENEAMFLSGAEKNSQVIHNHESVTKVLNNRQHHDYSVIEFTTFGIPIYNAAPLDTEQTANRFPIVGAISAGIPLEITPTDEFGLVSYPLFKSKSDLDKYLVFKINGLSMAPEIKHEDIVFVYKNNNWMELKNKVVAVRISGEMTLKKLVIDEQKRRITLVALNKEFQDLVLNEADLERTILIGELKLIRRIYK